MNHFYYFGATSMIGIQKLFIKGMFIHKIVKNVGFKRKVFIDYSSQCYNL